MANRQISPGIDAHCLRSFMCPFEMPFCEVRCKAGARIHTLSHRPRKATCKPRETIVSSRASFFRLAFRSFPAGQVLRKLHERKESENVDDTSRTGGGA
jgi:hypothetical protein